MRAMDIAGGCLVQGVFIPNASIKDGHVVRRPKKMQVITVSEVAAISKRPKELVFTLRCGKEITGTQDMDEVFAPFMAFAP